MQETLDNKKRLKKHKVKKRKNRALAFCCVAASIIAACICALTGFGRVIDVFGLFEEEPAHQHSWNTSIVKKASCTEDGLAFHTCEECAEERKTFLPAYGHALVNNACVDCGEKASEGLKFMLYTDEEDNGYAVITGIGTCAERELIIPSVIGGLPVKEIAENAFKGNLNIYSVSIPAGVKKIGDSAFRGCENLYTILLPQGVEEMGLGAFTNTAYYKDEANWDENGSLYRQGYLLEATYSIA